VVVCTGGGGLIAGIAVAVKALRPDVRVVAAQAAGAATFGPSLAAGRPVPLETMTTMADGIAVGCPGELPFALVRDLVDDVVTVDEEALSRALLLALERAKLVVEPAGAAALAAVMEHPESFEPPVVVVLSGGNIDPLLLSKLVRHGLVAASPSRIDQGSSPGCWACSATAVRTCWTWSTRAPAGRCTSTRSRSRCSSRPGAGRTVTRCCVRSPKRRTPSSSPREQGAGGRRGRPPAARCGWAGGWV